MNCDLAFAACFTIGAGVEFLCVWKVYPHWTAYVFTLGGVAGLFFAAVALYAWRRTR